MSRPEARPRPTTHAELNRLLVGVARRRGFGPDDAEDLAQEAWLRTQRTTRDREPHEVPGLALAALASAMSDHVVSPARRLRNRINGLLKEPVEPDPLQTWTVGATTVLGRRSQRRARPLSGSEYADLPARLGDFLMGARGLAGHNPHKVSTRQFLERFFRWLGRPVELTTLIDLLAPCHIEPREFAPIEPDELGAEPGAFAALGESRWSEVGWDQIVALGERSAAAILLRLEPDDLETLRPRSRERLSEAIPSWNPPPTFAEIELPVPDLLIAEQMGIEVNHLRVLRSRALVRLWTDYQTWRVD